MLAKIAIVNACTVLTDAEIASWVPAFHDQLVQDYAPSWMIDGSPAELMFSPKDKPPPADAWWITVVDHLQLAGALGYHDLTPAGAPMGLVGAQDALDDGVTPSSDANHELLEMIGDPFITTCVQYGNLFYAKELCDPCEVAGYEVKGVAVSNFILPGYFESNTPSGKFDFLGQITTPRTLLAGGYQLVFDIDSPNPSWQQILATERLARAKRKMIPKLGSRRERRRRSRHLWLRSTVPTT